MQRHELFSDMPVNLDFEGKRDDLEVYPLAGYVLGQMPRDLERVRDHELSYDDLATKHDALLSLTGPAIVANTDPQIAKVTQLDLLFMLGSYLPLAQDAFRNAPPSLLSIIHQQHDRFDIPVYMDYEMIIDVNSQEFEKHNVMRLFSTDPNFASSERDFYVGHSMAERFVKNAAYEAFALLTNPELHDASTVLSSASQQLTEFKLHMAEYGKYGTDGFLHIRPYLREYPDGTRNASGAFMPSVQLLELALHKPTSSYTAYIEESMDYFPKWSKPVIKEWYEKSSSGINLEDKIASGDIKVEDTAVQHFTEMVKQFIHFKRAHAGITNKHLPEAFATNDALALSKVIDFGERPIIPDSAERTGSGGFDVENVLGNGIFRALQLKRRIDEKHQDPGGH